MSTPSDSVFHRALCNLLTEIFKGPPGNEAFILNPGDLGLLRELESIDAQAASRRPMPGKTTVAAHADHVCYGLMLLNRWAAGETNPWADADWNASWERVSVDDAQWRKLRDQLRREVDLWHGHVTARTEWDELAASGALSSVAHTAYHLGAIRQILAAMDLHRG